MKQLEFKQLALSKGVPKERIKGLLDDRRSKIGPFDDDVEAPVAEPTTEPVTEELPKTDYLGVMGTKVEAPTISAPADVSAPSIIPPPKDKSELAAIRAPEIFDPNLARARTYAEQNVGQGKWDSDIKRNILGPIATSSAVQILDKLRSKPLEGETEEQKDARINKAYEKIERDIEKAGGMGVGEFGYMALEFLPYLKAASLLTKLPRAMKGALAFGAYETGTKAGEQLAENEKLEFAELAASGIQGLVMGGVFEVGGSALLNKLKAGAKAIDKRIALSAEENETIRNIYEAVTRKVIKDGKLVIDELPDGPIKDRLNQMAGEGPRFPLLTGPKITHGVEGPYWYMPRELPTIEMMSAPGMVVDLESQIPKILEDFAASGSITTVNAFRKFIKENYNTIISRERAKEILGRPKPGFTMREPSFRVKEVYDPAIGGMRPKVVSEAPGYPEAQAAEAMRIKLARERLQKVATGETKPSVADIPDSPPVDMTDPIKAAIFEGKKVASMLGKKEADVAGDVVKITGKTIQGVWDKYIGGGGKAYEWASPDRLQGYLKKYPEDVVAARYGEILERAAEWDVKRSADLTIENIIKLDEHLAGSGISLSGNLTGDTIIESITKSLDALMEMKNASMNRGAFVETANNAFDVVLKGRRIWGQMGLALQKYGEQTGNKKVLQAYSRIMTKLSKTDKLLDDVAKMKAELATVNPKDPASIDAFFNKYVTKMDQLKQVTSAYRYANMLSSPLTHLVNFIGTAIGITLPVFHKFTQALIDDGLTRLKNVGYKISGSDKRAVREYFYGEAAKYAKSHPLAAAFLDRGALRNAWKSAKESYGAGLGYAPEMTEYWATLPEAEAAQARRSWTEWIRRERKKSKNPFKKVATVFEFIPQSMNAADMFFRSFARGGEYDALMLRSLKGADKLTEEEIKIISEEKAMQYVYRGKLHPEGQGVIFNAIDDMAKVVLSMRQHKNPVINTIANLMAPFVMAPVNIGKSGITFTPLGFIDIAQASLRYGSDKKKLAKLLTEFRRLDPTTKEAQAMAQTLIERGIVLGRTKDELMYRTAKAINGTVATIAIANMGLDGHLKWAPSDDRVVRNAQAQAGIPPYSVVNDKGQSMSYLLLGELALPVTMVTAYQHYLRKITNDKVKTRKYTDVAQAFFKAAALGPLQYIGSLPMTQQVGVLMDFTRGTMDREEVGNKLAAQSAKQFVPMTGMLSYVNGLFDRMARDPESFADYMSMGIYGLSKYVPTYSATDISLGSVQADIHGKAKVKMSLAPAKRESPIPLLGNLVRNPSLALNLQRAKSKAYHSGATNLDYYRDVEKAYYEKPGSSIRKFLDKLYEESRMAE